ncbi:unnamed protein product [Arctogadus glacialis]
MTLFNSPFLNEEDFAQILTAEQKSHRDLVPRSSASWSRNGGGQLATSRPLHHGVKAASLSPGVDEAVLASEEVNSLLLLPPAESEPSGPAQ